MTPRQIPALTVDEFAVMYERNPRLLHENPWIVNGYIKQWACYSDWQDMSVLRARFGHLSAFAKAPNFVTNRRTSLVSVETDFARYLDYIAEPHRVRELYEGRWMDGSYEAFIAQDLPLYCGTLRFVRSADDPLFTELEPLVPSPIAPWNHALPYYYSLFNHLWLLVSLPGALTPLHVDNNGTIALIAQLRGRKRATLFAPTDLRHVYRDGVGFMDPEAPDATDFPSWREATPWVGDLVPGQVLFVGTDWAHHVRTLETSISVSFDFVDQSNFVAYATSPDWAVVLGNRALSRPDVFLAKLAGAITQSELATLSPTELGRKVMRAILHASLRGGASDETANIRRLYLHHLEQTVLQGVA